MLAILFWICILAGAFFFIAFALEFVVIMFLGLAGVALWGEGFGGQAIVVVLLLLFIFNKK